MLLTYLRTAFLYLVLIGAIRLLGKRQVGQMEPSEFVVTMLVANFAAFPLEDSSISLVTGLVPILTVLGLELVLSYLTLRSTRLRRLLCGRPVILIENGRILQENLRSTRISMDELMAQLRQKDILKIQSVQFAILETNGGLSVFPFPRERPATAKETCTETEEAYLPITLVEDGKVCRENLIKSGREERWVKRTLRERKSNIPHTLLLTVDDSGEILWIGKEEQK